MADNDVTDMQSRLRVDCIEKYHTPECVQQNHTQRLGRARDEKVLMPLQ